MLKNNFTDKLLNEKDWAAIFISDNINLKLKRH